MNLSPHSISEFAIGLLKQDDLDSLVREFAKQIGELLGYEDVVIYLMQGEAELRQVAAVGPKDRGENRVANPIRIRIGEGIVGQVAGTAKAEIVSNTDETPHYIRDGYGGMSEITVPILHEGNVIGVVDSENREPGFYSEQDIENLTILAGIAAPRIASARQHENHIQAQSQQVESLSIFVGGIAHDFNNNLQAMGSSISVAKTMAPNLCQFLEIAEQACEKSRGLTEQLLQFAKGSGPRREEVDLCQLVHETAKLALTTRNSTYDIHCAPDLLNPTIDRSQIEQVVSNLLINADQSYANGGKIEVEISATTLPCDANQPATLIQIRDFGSGISPEQMSEIFKPNFTTKPSGNGLGLAVSLFIVRRHQGDIRVESQLGEGTTIRLYLPIEQTTPSTVQPTAAADTQQLKIMLVDDEPGVQAGVAAYLDSLGYTPILASTANEAIDGFTKAIKDHSPISAVIIDKNIPNSDGTTILNLLRKLDPNVPAILTSGSDVLHESASKLLGFSGVLAKPFKLAGLQDALRRVLNTE